MHVLSIHILWMSWMHYNSFVRNFAVRLLHMWTKFICTCTTTFFIACQFAAIQMNCCLWQFLCSCNLMIYKFGSLATSMRNFKFYVMELKCIHRISILQPARFFCLVKTNIEGSAEMHFHFFIFKSKLSI